MTEVPQIPPPPPLPWQPSRPSRLSAIVCWIAILGTIGFVAARVFLSREAAPAPEDDVAHVSNLDIEMTARLTVGQKQIAVQFQQPTTGAQNTLRTLDARARTPIDQLRTAIVAGEVNGADDAQARFDELKSRATTQPIIDDLATLEKIYSGQLDELTPDERTALVDRHKWFGQLALAFNLSDADPQRQLVIRPARRAAWVSAGAVIGVVGLVGAGAILLILAIVLASTGTIRRQFYPVTADPSRPAFLEAFAIYIVLFFVVVHALNAITNWPPIIFYLLSLGLIPLALYWPTRRGMSWRDSRIGFGWHRGRGVFAELGAGVLGYITGLPIVAIGFVMTFILTRVVAGTDASHPIVNELRDAGVGSIVAIFFMVGVYAPVMEETMFRGALYNHLRGRIGWFVSSLLVGLLFAAVHPQGWAAIPVLGSIGAVLCFVREWRGSLIGPMIAHGLHNSTALTMFLLLMR